MITYDRNSHATRLLMALPIAALTFSLAACGGAARPSSDRLSDGIMTILKDNKAEAGYTDAIVDCIADELLDSKISDQDLASIAAGKDFQTNQETKDLVTDTMRDAVKTCATAK